MSDLKNLSEEEKKSLKLLFTTKKLQRNEVVSTQNYNHISIIVREGILRKYVYKDGKEKTINLYFPKDLILVPHLDYCPLFPYKIQAIQPSTVDIMNMKDYNMTKNKSMNLLKMDIDILETALDQTMLRLETFQLMNATERYLELLNRSPEMIQKVPLKHVSSYLGINNASLSKIRAGIK